MKKILLCSGVFFLIAFCKPAAAQFQKLDNNVKEQPKWGPSGHDYVEYYYLPEIETYYYVPGKQFIYQSDGGYWTFSSFLPKAKKHIDLRSANKVVINEPGAYRYFAEHKSKYANSQSSTAISEQQPSDNTKQSDSFVKKSG